MQQCLIFPLRRHLYEKLGFKLEGITRDSMLDTRVRLTVRADRAVAAPKRDFEWRCFGAHRTDRRSTRMAGGLATAPTPSCGLSMPSSRGVRSAQPQQELPRRTVSFSKIELPPTKLSQLPRMQHVLRSRTSAQSNVVLQTPALPVRSGPSPFVKPPDGAQIDRPKVVAAKL